MTNTETEPRLIVEIDGQQHNLNDCFWVRTDPTGCAYSSIHGDMASTAEQAHRQMKPLKRDRDRDDRQGYTVRLLTHEQWDAEARPCFLSKCDHQAATLAGSGR
jgi:hypothetical protein